MPGKQKAEIRLDNDGRYSVECPVCHEMLQHPDLEVFMSCPFCGCNLEENLEMEDFLMDPVVRSWISRGGAGAHRQ